MSRVFLGALGNAICLDQSQNTVACMDPSCTYGDCGSSDTQQVGGSLCLDQAENQIACTSPNCTYGDCVAPRSSQGFAPQITIAPASGLNIPSRPSPVLNVPLSASSIPLFFESSTLVSGIPNWELLIGAAVGAMLLSTAFSGGGRRRRR